MTDAGGAAQADLGDPGGVQRLRESLTTATAHGDHEPAGRA